MLLPCEAAAELIAVCDVAVSRNAPDANTPDVNFSLLFCVTAKKTKGVIIGTEKKRKA